MGDERYVSAGVGGLAVLLGSITAIPGAFRGTLRRFHRLEIDVTAPGGRSNNPGVYLERVDNLARLPPS